MLPPKARQYLMYDLQAGPQVLSRLFSSVADPAIYDLRPDPERFTLREMLAHLADWEPIFQKRLRQTRDEDHAVLIGIDEGQVAIDHDYAHADPQECLARFQSGRLATLELLGGLAPEQWGRTATHTEVGPITLEQQAQLIAAHDGYHQLQTVQWINML